MYTEIILDKPRRLRFDMTAMRDLEAALGHPLGVIWQQLQQMGVSALCLTLWAGLKHEDKALTQNLTNKIVERYVANGGKLKPIITAVSEAMESSDVFKSLIEDDELGNDSPEPATTKTESR